ncbi:molybdopterin-dependent oxidoreductase [Endozoicomonas ascidiicola]|uniref:molybdopterin-dependent oxidoreductase n=1 Tax=Endozoicomonas ascidiicola TaxID=1698521 RepID=UPI00082C1D91|nr:molybdopterin-dependent oxidoreductase [Endozoicomonas ascidiicola]
MFLWTDAIYRHSEMTDKTDGIRRAERLSQSIKFIWNYAGNCIINQHSDINRTHEILQDESQCEMIVVIENHITSSARYAEIWGMRFSVTPLLSHCMSVVLSTICVLKWLNDWALKKPSQKGVIRKPDYDISTRFSRPSPNFLKRQASP